MMVDYNMSSESLLIINVLVKELERIEGLSHVNPNIASDEVIAWIKNRILELKG
jgi:hypothetical protein